MSGVFFWFSVLSLVFGAAIAPVKKNVSTQAAFVLGAAGGLFAILAGLSALFGARFGITFSLGYGFGAVTFGLDRLSAFFVLVSGMVLLPVSIYATGYEVRGPRWVFAALYDLLMAATLLVFAADHVFLFMLFWELTAVLFYGLVSFEDLREGRVGAGYLFSAASKLGTTLIFVAFFLAYTRSGSFGFGEMARSSIPTPYANAIFLLSFVGFGVKAGMVPLQLWLPDAHSKSPKPVSALLAGVVLNLGFYGVWRVDMQVLGAGPEWRGLLALLVGGISPAVGILYRIAQRDLSRFVAYSSVENGGIILIGIGASMLGWAAGLKPLAGLGLLVALYHMLHHSASKSLLLLGVVDHATGTTDMDRLGGLAQRMPLTSALCFVAALSLAAMPPSGGFATEWLSFEPLMQGFRLSSLAGKASMAIAGALLALASALAILGFVKVYGSVFLGRPRNEYPAGANQPPVSGRVGMLLLAILALSLGIIAPYWIRLVGRASAGIVSGNISEKMFGTPSVVLQPAYPNFSALSPTLLAAALPLLALMTAGVVAVVWRPQSKSGPVWASGEPFLGGAEYTSPGFSNPIRTVFYPFYRPTEKVKGAHLHLPDSALAGGNLLRGYGGVADVGHSQDEEHPIGRFVRLPGVRAGGVRCDAAVRDSPEREPQHLPHLRADRSRRGGAVSGGREEIMQEVAREVFSKVMLAWDGSENAATAYEVACDLADRYGAQLVAVSVVNAPEHAELPGEKERALEEARAFYSRKLEPLLQRAQATEAELRHEVIPGDHPAEALIEYARRNAFDLIVIGRRGMGRSSWFRIGSVSDRVARYAHCAVMVIGRGE